MKVAAKQMLLHLNYWNLSNKLSFREEEIGRCFGSGHGSKVEVRMTSLDIGNIKKRIPLKKQRI